MYVSLFCTYFGVLAAASGGGAAASGGAAEASFAFISRENL
jgi:hypothetical protein